MTAAPPLPAVVLAAGGASRFGSPKQLAMLEGVSLVERAVRSAVDAGAAPVIVVLGANAEAVRQAVGPAVDLFVHNERWAEGLAGSVAAGLRGAVSLVPECRGLLITLADQPLVDARALGAVLAAFPGAHGAAASEHDGVLGVPAAIGREHFGALFALREDRGAGAWLRAHRDLVVPVPMPTAAFDVDTPADLDDAIRSTG